MNFLLTCTEGMGKRYIEINNVKRILVCKHHLGEKGYQLWYMSGENTGTYHAYTRKKDALRDAKKICERFDLPLTVE